MDNGNIGEMVWYVVGTTREHAKIVAISGSTHATIKLLTGPQSGKEFETPWGIIEPYTELPKKLPRKPAYSVTADNKVISREGTIYDEGNEAVAQELAAFLNSKDEFEEALEAALDKHDYPLSGTEWLDMLRKIGVKGEQS
jgi:hypothetical protein